MSRQISSLYFVDLHNCAILEQLYLEEALLRLEKRNFCLINYGSPPAIILGISQKKEEVIQNDPPFPLIRRFSGGGGVIIDEETIFITLILNQDVANIPLQPEAIMRWSEPLYQKTFLHPQFALRENDYVIARKKCGGNAQYLRKGRFLHHTSFLWDFDPLKMNYLKYPPKAPSYRKERSHQEFLCTINSHFPSKAHFFTRFKDALSSQFHLLTLEPAELQGLLHHPHRRATTLI